MKPEGELYEDNIQLQPQAGLHNRVSRYCDLLYYRSSVTPGLWLAMRVQKPAKPAPMLVRSHGWHMSMPAYEPMDEPRSDYLTVDVDMRGRAFSQGKPDCNALELYDFIDAAEVAQKQYAEWISDPRTIYFEGGSGGGGNAFAIAGKFPDYFAHITATSGISDYSLWYKNDAVGEFRDEMDMWIGASPDESPSAYEVRSGITIVPNLLTPMFIAHGETDIRVPCEHARRYVQRCAAEGKSKLVNYMELAGVGDRGHFGKASPEQMDEMAAAIRRHRHTCIVPPALPEKGSLIVAGYVKTRMFEISLRDSNRVAQLQYDLKQNRFEIPGLNPQEYTVTQV